jgi:hypothetical protein
MFPSTLGEACAGAVGAASKPDSSAKRIAKVSPISVFLMQQPRNFSRNILPTGLAFRITPTPAIRPTSANLKNAWLQDRNTQHDETKKEQFASGVRLVDNVEANSL